MDLSKATPQEISEYKIHWMMGTPVRIDFHSDYHIEAKEWCRRNLERWQWKFDKYTGVYQHTIWFEFAEDANDFITFKEKGFKYDTK